MRKSGSVSALPGFASKFAKMCEIAGDPSGSFKSASAARSSATSSVPLLSLSKRRNTSPTVSSFFAADSAPLRPPTVDAGEAGLALLRRRSAFTTRVSSGRLIVFALLMLISSSILNTAAACSLGIDSSSNAAGTLLRSSRSAFASL